MKQNYDTKLRDAVAKYRQKIKAEVMVGSRGSTYPTLKRLGARPFEKTGADFQILSHATQGLTPQQSVEVIAAHFSKISQEYPPLQISSLPPNIQSALDAPDMSYAPLLDVHTVRKKLIKAKKPQGIVSGDLPKKLVQNCVDLLAPPATYIFNSITHSAQYPLS